MFVFMHVSLCVYALICTLYLCVFAHCMCACVCALCIYMYVYCVFMHVYDWHVCVCE